LYVDVVPLGGDITSFYESLRDRAHGTIAIDNDGVICGTEGYVVYVWTGDRWAMYKAKPPEIEKIHWAPETIDYNSVYVTAKNALEDLGDEDLTVERVKTLLLEEFNEHQVERSEERIWKAVIEVKRHAELLAKIREAYGSVISSFPSVAGDKGLVMRRMTSFFCRADSRLVYNGLRELGLLP